jgi:cbb3-type cytochrome oxidase subunit 3
MSVTRIVNINNTPWLLGLSWRSFEEIPTRSDIRTDAAQLGAIWYVLRIGKFATQCGFGNPPPILPIHARGLYSLAAYLADTESQPWRGVFQLEEDIWWYIAVRDGHAILPDGDQVGDQVMLLAVREKHACYDDWHEIEGDILNLSERIAAQKSKKNRVRSLKVSVATIFQAIALTMLLAGFVVGYVWWQHRVQATLNAHKAAMAMLKSGMATQRDLAHPSPLLATPDAMRWLKACQTIIDAVPLSEDGGWTLSGVICHDKVVDLVWNRKWGATVLLRPDGELRDNDTVMSSARLPVLPNGQGKMLDLALAKTRLTGNLQKSDIHLQMISSPVVPVLPGQVAVPVVAMTQPGMPFSFDTRIPVFDLDLDMPGLRLSQISTTLTGWHVEGVLYGQ